MYNQVCALQGVLLQATLVTIWIEHISIRAKQRINVSLTSRLAVLTKWIHFVNIIYIFLVTWDLKNSIIFFDFLIRELLNGTFCCWRKLTPSSFITVHKRSCGIVMFLHMSVILFTGGYIPACITGPMTPPWADTLPLGQTPLGRHPPGRHPSSEDTPLDVRSMSGRYASYWNAFLLWNIFLFCIFVQTWNN